MSPLTESVNLVLRNKWAPMDADAAAYITAVEAADTSAGQSGGLEEKTKIAIDNFVLECKQDGIWNAIKASCILAGAKTLSGALVPLVGAAPTNYNFVSGDYDRKTGLMTTVSSKYLDSNRAGNADPQDSSHLALYVSTLATATSSEPIMGNGSTNTGSNLLSYRISNSTTLFRSRNASADLKTNTIPGLIGLSRSSSTQYTIQHNATSTLVTRTSQASLAANIFVFRSSASSFSHEGSRITYYSIGEALDLALLDTRVTALITAIGAAF